MDPAYRSLVDFLRGLDIEDVPHSGHKGFLAHLVAVYSDLEEWGCSRDVCRAGLFHSIYGTELFRRWSLPLDRRPDIRALIGERAEWIAYVNCMMDRSTFDALLASDGPFRIRNRESGEIMELSREDYDDLVRVHLCDWLEQVARSARWDYRPDAIRRMAMRLGGVAQESYDRVYSAAPDACQA
ncbi:MAG TPA: hypothetical protein VFQ26_05370 [Nitrospiraceae bacterium]|nr:hypothetical protein [Nitrospiraceae bacterium]